MGLIMIMVMGLILIFNILVIKTYVCFIHGIVYGGGTV